MSKLYKSPKGIIQTILFGLGFVLFWLLFPIWMLLSFLWWREDSLFVVLHVQALFYNSWEIFK